MEHPSFNPRTYIRYDIARLPQSYPQILFQSTYLYKVRPCSRALFISLYGFNPRTYIRYDVDLTVVVINQSSFNPRTYIRYDRNNQNFVSIPFVSIHVPI